MPTPTEQTTTYDAVPFDDELLADIERPAHVGALLGNDGEANAERRRRAERLAAAVHERPSLEELRSTYIRRLHRRSDDFAATEALRTVEAAVSLVAR